MRKEQMWNLQLERGLRLRLMKQMQSPRVCGDCRGLDGGWEEGEYMLGVPEKPDPSMIQAIMAETLVGGGGG